MTQEIVAEEVLLKPVNTPVDGRAVREGGSLGGLRLRESRGGDGSGEGEKEEQAVGGWVGVRRGRNEDEAVEHEATPPSQGQGVWVCSPTGQRMLVALSAHYGETASDRGV